MMSSKDSTPLPARLSASYKQLASSAATLNAASDELGKSITSLDASLQRLNLGIETWVRVGGWENPDADFSIRQLGYVKIYGKWGIGLRTVYGHEQDPEHVEKEEWLFNDAPRAARIEAIEWLPALLDQLIKDADATAQKIKDKTDQANEFAAAISATTPASARRSS
jgi:prefoldin subunit 5